MKNDILCLEDRDGCLFFENSEGGRVVFLYYLETNEKHIDSLVKEIDLPIASIIRLYVHPNYRKLGWAKIIMNLFIDKYKGCNIIVDAFPDDKDYMSIETLISFYKSFGFDILKPSEDGFLLHLNKINCIDL